MMNGYDSWKERPVSTTSLLLDAKNPRIPDIGHVPTQREIIEELVLHDDVYELARNISDLGYFPTEFLIGIEENGALIIVEGNRRLSAVKLLLSPELAPDRYVKKFRLLQSKASPEQLRKLRVLFAPSREAAAPLIISRHTGDVVERWKPAQQAKYLRSLVTPDLSIDDVARRYGMTRSAVLDNIKTDIMYQIACRLALPDTIREKVRDPRSFNTSALERLVQSTKAMEFLGAKFDDDGKLVGHIAEDEFRKGYARMVADVASGKIDTRSLNNSKQIQTYLDGFGADAPNRRRKGSFTSDSLLHDPTVKAPHAVPQHPIQRGATARISQHLVPSGFKCELKNARINEIVWELKHLKVAQHTNACAVLLRVLLELLLGNYLEATKQIQPLLEAAKKKGRPDDWYPTLKMLMAATLGDSTGTLKLSPLARKALNKMVSEDSYALSLDKLDQYVHNRYISPSEKDLRRFWAQLEDLLIQLVVPHQAKPAPALTAVVPGTPPPSPATPTVL